MRIPFLYLAIAAGTLAGAPAPAQTFTFQTFTFQTFKLHGASSTNPRAFGPAGQLVGYYLHGTTFQGFVGTAAKFRSFHQPGALATLLTGYANGLYVGFNEPLSGSTTSFISANGKSSTTLSVPGAQGTEAQAINASGEVVGLYVPASGSAEEAGFAYRNGTYSTFLVPGSFDTEIDGINDAGTMVGSYRPATQGNFAGFMLRNGTMTSFAYPGAYQTFGTGINNAGEIVGYYQAQAGGPFAGFVYDGTNYASFSPPGTTSAYAYGINDAGQVTGFGVTRSGDIGYVGTPAMDGISVALPAAR